MRPGERDGGGYWFTSREKMNEDIANHKYLEYGEYENHLYGTKLDSIRQVMRFAFTMLNAPCCSQLNNILMIRGES